VIPKPIAFLAMVTDLYNLMENVHVLWVNSKIIFKIIARIVHLNVQLVRVKQIFAKLAEEED
jgi:hypothetical protein